MNSHAFIERPSSKGSIASKGSIFGVGINDADYITSLDSEAGQSRCPYYQKWRDMISRCHSASEQARHPTYSDCKVCDEWLVFSVFKSWMIKQDWEGKDLDKDLINPGNRTYSPEGCCFISGELNRLLLNNSSSKGEFPRGVYFNRQCQKYQASIGGTKKRQYLGVYNTPEAASNAYIKAKVDTIIKAAGEQSDHRISAGLILHAKLLMGKL